MEAKYTKEGCLIGHVLMGRDMVREAALKLDDFPDELLLNLEHAILAIMANGSLAPRWFRRRSKPFSFLTSTISTPR